MSDLMASIIVPIYNSERYLEKCLDSLLNQTVDGYEIILIDDGSKDNSGKICDLYREKSKVFKVIHQDNLGVSMARNAGLDIAEGKYLLFCDSDDFVEPDFVEAYIKAFEKSDCDLIITKMRVINPNKEERYTFSESKELIIKKGNFLEIWKKSLLGEMCSKGFKNEIIKLNNLRFDTSTSYGEDLCFICSYIQEINSDIFLCPQYVYNYVQREDSLITKYYKDSFEDVYKKMFNSMCSTINSLEIDSEENLTHFYTGYFFRFIRCITHAFNKQNRDSIIIKIKQGRKVLFSEEYKKCYKNMDKSCIAKSFMFICRFKSVLLIMAYIVMTSNYFSIIKKEIY